MGSDDMVIYEVLWAVGQIGGAGAIVEVMMRMHDNERVMARCLAVFAKQLWRPEESDIEKLPPVLERLVKIADHFLQGHSGWGDEGQKIESQKHSVEALGGVINTVCQYTGPRTLPAADQGVQLLIRAIGPGFTDMVARSAAASLGHMVVGAPAWREALHTDEFFTILGRRISKVHESEEENVQHQRCFCWVA